MSLLVTTALVLSLTVLSALVGIRVGRALRNDITEPERDQLHRMLASLLGLLALLLGFSFAMAGARYDLRKELVVDEANAIGTARLRAGALADARGHDIEHLLDAYVATRLRGARARDDAGLRAAIGESMRLQVQIWSLVGALTREQPQSLPASLLMQATNDVIDLHTKRLTAYRNRVPTSVLVMLLAIAAVSMGWAGASVGVSHRHGATPTVLLSLIIALVIGVVIDLDAPRTGFIRVNQTPIVELQRSLE